MADEPAALSREQPWRCLANVARRLHADCTRNLAVARSAAQSRAGKNKLPVDGSGGEDKRVSEQDTVDKQSD